MQLFTFSEPISKNPLKYLNVRNSFPNPLLISSFSETIPQNPFNYQNFRESFPKTHFTIAIFGNHFQKHFLSIDIPGYVFRPSRFSNPAFCPDVVLNSPLLPPTDCPYTAIARPQYRSILPPIPSLYRPYIVLYRPYIVLIPPLYCPYTVPIPSLYYPYTPIPFTWEQAATQIV